LNIIGDLLDAYDEPKILSLAYRLGKSDRFDVSQIHKYLHQAIYLPNNAAYVDQMLLPRKVVKFESTDIVAMYCYLFCEVKQQLKEDIKSEIESLAERFKEKYLRHGDSIFDEESYKQVLDILKDTLESIDHHTPIKDADYWQYYEAIELSWQRALEFGGYNLMLDIMLPSVLSENYFANPIIPINIMKEARLERTQTKQDILNLMRATKERKDHRKELEKITAPTIIIQGEKDLLLPVHLANEVHKHIKNSEFKVVANAGHTLNLEHVPEVCGFIKEFLGN